MVILRFKRAVLKALHTSHPNLKYILASRQILSERRTFRMTEILASRIHLDSSERKSLV